MFTVERVKQWFKGKKDEFGRLKKLNLSKKTGSRPSEFNTQQKFLWENFMFLWSEIKTKNVGTETQVGSSKQYTTDFWVCHAGGQVSLALNPCKLFFLLNIKVHYTAVEYGGLGTLTTEK